MPAAYWGGGVSIGARKTSAPSMTGPERRVWKQTATFPTCVHGKYAQSV